MNINKDLQLAIDKYPFCDAIHGITHADFVALLRELEKQVAELPERTRSPEGKTGLLILLLLKVISTDLEDAGEFNRRVQNIKQIIEIAREVIIQNNVKSKVWF